MTIFLLSENIVGVSHIQHPEGGIYSKRTLCEKDELKHPVQCEAMNRERGNVATCKHCIEVWNDQYTMRV